MEGDYGGKGVSAFLIFIFSSLPFCRSASLPLLTLKCTF